MDKRRERIEEEVEKTLRLLDHREEVQMNPYFSSRLEARIRNLQEEREAATGRILGVAWLRPALILFLVLINLFSVMAVFRKSEKRSTDREEYLMALAKEYSVSQDNLDSVFGRN